MTPQRRWLHLIFILGVSLLAVWIWLATAAISIANNSPIATTHSTITNHEPTNNPITPPHTPIILVEPVPLGGPCGAGTQLPPWVLCLYGTISIVDAQGESTPLAGVPFTVSRNNQVVSGTTVMPPGQLTPAYRVDISPLQPAFLQSVTLTANISGTLVQQQIIVFPDFQTQSQQFDLLAPMVGVLDPNLLWGHVVDFAVGGPVTQAVVTAFYNGLAITGTTVMSYPQPLPVYHFNAAELATIGVFPGDLVTLTAAYDGDIDQKQLLVSEEPQQVDFVTGWKCDDFDPLPQEGGADGLPQEGGADGLPDVACIWGYGLVDGTPTPGMDIQLTISGTTYAGVTHDFPGEDLPRYGIGIWGSDVISGQSLLATGVYSGFVGSRQTTLSLSAAHEQRLDIPLGDPQVLANFTQSNDVMGMTFVGGYIWAATTGGVARWLPDGSSYTVFTTADGLVANYARAIAHDSAGHLWIGTYQGGVSRFNPTTNEWQTFNTANSELPSNTVYAVFVDDYDVIWFGTQSGVARYMPGTGGWTIFTTEDGLVGGSVQTIAVDNAGYFWFGTSVGASRFNPVILDWQNFTESDSGLSNDTVYDIATNDDGDVWFATLWGVSRYNIITQQWGEALFASDGGLLDNWVLSLALDTSYVYIGSRGGLNRYYPSNDTWASYTHQGANSLAANDVRDILTDIDPHLYMATYGGGISRYTTPFGPWLTLASEPTLSSNGVTGIAADANDNLWFATSPKITEPGGIVHYAPGLQLWETLTTESGLADNEVSTVYAAPDNTVWFGTIGGLSHYTPTMGAWATFTTVHGLAHDNVTSIAQDQNGSMWFGTGGGGVSHYNPNTNVWQSYSTAEGLVGNFVRAIAVANDNRVWLGTSTGASVYDPTLQQFQNYTVSDGLAGDIIRAVAFDFVGNIWFGTTNGASRYTPTTQTWRTFSTTHGLAHNDIRAIAIHPDGSIWFGTSLGVSHYYPTTQQWESFGSGDGFASSMVRAIEIDADDAMWFGSEYGISQMVGAAKQSDLALQCGAPPAILPGSTYTYDCALSNRGQLAATGSILTFTLPQSVTLVNASLLPTTTIPLAWDLGTLAAGESDTPLIITVAAHISLTPGPILIASARLQTSSSEVYVNNNQIEVAISVSDPYRADTGVALAGPPVLVPGETATYRLLADNIGGLTATITTLEVTLDAALGYLTADPAPSTISPLVWNLGELAPLSPPLPVNLTITVAPDLPSGSDLAVSAYITSTTAENYLLNNQAVITVSTSLTDALSLILVTPGRLVARYGTSPLLPRLYQLAEHPRVRGAILDVTTDAAVAAAYADWDAHPGSWQKANDVAAAIKSLIDQYTITYPRLRYLVLVGSDDMIPFYRVADQNGTYWQEDSYAGFLPGGTVRDALAADRLLTDDFYADRAPVVPDSPFWLDGHSLYLPDFAVGRLVETPDEILAVINAFLAQDGMLVLENAVVGSLDELTDDLGQSQCQAAASDGLITVCTESNSPLRQAALNQTGGFLLTSQHSNHFSLGSLSVDDLRERLMAFENTLLATIGCHGGLSVSSTTGPLPDDDIPQAFLGRGGTIIGPTAYTYASGFGLGYSESLADLLTVQLVFTQTQTLGEALIQAKQQYFTSRVGWFDYLDEKVVLPVTLYGLPMLQVTTPNLVRQKAPESSPFHPEVGMLGNWTGVTYTLTGLTYTPHITTEGYFFDYQGQTLAQEQLPVQPALQLPQTPPAGGGTPRGILLHGAGYSRHEAFDPVVAQSWAMGMPEPYSRQEPAVLITGWDRALPYDLGIFEGLTRTVSSLNLVLGAYRAEPALEILFHQLHLTIIYSDQADEQSPTLVSYASQQAGNAVRLSVNANDPSGISLVQAICDNGQGEWQGITLSAVGSLWFGYCPGNTVRTFVQLVDGAGNITVSDWIAPAPPAPLAMLSPLNTPVQIPAQGGYFLFRLGLFNYSAETQSFQFWTSGYMPDGTPLEPLFGPIAMTLQPGQSFPAFMWQVVPGNMPAGKYTFVLNAGTYPNGIVSQHAFTFNKLYSQTPGNQLPTQPVDILKRRIGWRSGFWTAPDASFETELPSN